MPAQGKLTNTDYCEATISLRNTIEEGFCVLGERLHKILEGKLYEPKWESWQEFLEDLRIRPDVASKLIRIYQVLILEYKLSPKKIYTVGTEIAYDITRVVKSKEEAVEWLEKGETLRLGDVRIAIKEKKTGVTQADCRHNFYVLRVCFKCGYKVIDEV